MKIRGSDVGRKGFSCGVFGYYGRNPPREGIMAIDPRQKELWLYELKLNGFIILRSFLPLDLIEGMSEQFRPLLDGEIERLRAGDTSALRGPNRMSFDIARYVDLLKGPLDDDRFRRNPVVEELVGAVLGRWRRGVTKAECPLK